MTQAELDREIARATGESLRTVAFLGFVPLTVKPFEREREPLMFDWDEVADRRDGMLSVY